MRNKIILVFFQQSTITVCNVFMLKRIQKFFQRKKKNKLGKKNRLEIYKIDMMRIYMILHLLSLEDLPSCLDAAADDGGLWLLLGTCNGHTVYLLINM